MRPSAVAEQQRDRLGLVAAAPPLIPPRSWFETPEPEDPSEGGWTVTADGQVYGYAALWESCHTGKPGRCVKPPRSASDYGYYMTGLTETDDGELIPTGRITLGTGHASLTASPAATAEHYDNTGAVAADVRITDGKHGIWVSGALRPDVTPERARVLRGASLSGDWRNIRGQLELLGLLAVNVPGFPVPRAMSASGELEDGEELLALVAAGVITEPICVEEGEEVDEADWDAALRNLTDAMAHSEEVTAQPVDPVTAALASTPASGTRYTEPGGGGGMAAAGRFDESKHPREPKGKREGGRFAQKRMEAQETLMEMPDASRSDKEGALQDFGIADNAAEAKKLVDAVEGKESPPRPGSHEEYLEAGEHFDRQRWENSRSFALGWARQLEEGQAIGGGGAGSAVRITRHDGKYWVDPEGNVWDKDALGIYVPPASAVAYSSPEKAADAAADAVEQERVAQAEARADRLTSAADPMEADPSFIEELVAAMMEAIDEPGEKSSTVPLTADASPGRARARKIAEVMREFKAGTLKSSDGTKVTDRKQALAIAMSKSEHLTADGAECADDSEPDEDEDDKKKRKPGDPMDLPVVAAAFDESKHPRHKKGSHEGGKFAPKGGGDDSPAGHEFPLPELVDTVRRGKVKNLTDAELARVAKSGELADKVAAEQKRRAGGGKSTVQEARDELSSEARRVDATAGDMLPGDKVMLNGKWRQVDKVFHDKGKTRFTARGVKEHEWASDEEIRLELVPDSHNPNLNTPRDKARKEKFGLKASGDPMDLPAAGPRAPRPDDSVTAASFTEPMRAKLAKKGEAMPDGSFPIRNRTDLRKAISDVGRASDPEVARKWIIRRARELKAVDALPASWDVEAVAAAGTFDESKHPRHKAGSKDGGKFASKSGGVSDRELLRRATYAEMTDQELRSRFDKAVDEGQERVQRQIDEELLRRKSEGEGGSAGKLVTGPGGKPMSRTEAGELLDKERAGTSEAKADRAEKESREAHGLTPKRVEGDQVKEAFRELSKNDLGLPMWDAAGDEAVRKAVSILMVPYEGAEEQGERGERRRAALKNGLESLDRRAGRAPKGSGSRIPPVR